MLQVRVEEFYQSLADKLTTYSIDQARADIAATVRHLVLNGIAYNPIRSFRLLSDTSKMRKQAEERGYYALGVQFRSAMRTGYPLCPTALLEGLSCIKPCIDESGNGSRPNVREAREWKAQFLAEHPRKFLSLLVYEMDRANLCAISNGLKLAIRLNVFSDVPWVTLVPWLFEAYPTVQFYDYFKELAVFLFAEIPSNYHLTYSFHEKSNWEWCESMLRRGTNVAVVFETRDPDELPDVFKGWPVINGDLHDMRFQDPTGHIVALAAKGRVRSAEKLAAIPFFTPIPAEACISCSLAA